MESILRLMYLDELEEYAKKHDGAETGKFIALTSKGFVEFQWYDAHYGFVKILQPGGIEGVLTKGHMYELFGQSQKYIPTSGYKIEDEDLPLFPSITNILKGNIRSLLESMSLSGFGQISLEIDGAIFYTVNGKSYVIKISEAPDYTPSGKET